MIHTKESIDKTLREIQQSVPALLRKAVVTKTIATPTVMFVVDKALEDPDFPQEKKDKLLELKEAGYFNKEKPTENPKVAQQIENYVARKTKEAIKEGRLPTKKQFKELQELWKQQEQTSSKV